MTTVAVIIQLDGRDGVGPDCLFNIHYSVVDNVAQTFRNGVVQDLALPSASLGTWKSLIVDGIIAHAATIGYTLTAASVRYITYEPGDYRYTDMVAAWTKDITKTNIPTTRTNVYLGLNGEGQLVDFANFKQGRLVIFGNKVGTGNLTHGLYVVGTETDNMPLTYTGAAGEFMSDSGWIALPAWAIGEKIVKPMALSTVATDDPIYRQFVLYVR